MSGIDPKAMAEIADGLDAVVEIVGGYKAKFVAAGFSQEAAEAMSIGLHQTLMTTMQGAVQK